MRNIERTVPPSLPSPNQVLKHGFVCEGACITKVGDVSSGDFGQDSAHDFARSCLGEGFSKLDFVGGSNWADDVSDMLLESNYKIVH